MGSWYIKPGWSGTKAGTEVAPYATAAELEANGTYAAEAQGERNVYVAPSDGTTIGAFVFTKGCSIRPWSTYATHVKSTGLVSLGTLLGDLTTSNVSTDHWLLEGAPSGLGTGANGMAMLHIDFYTRLHRCGLPAASFRRVASRAICRAATDACFFYDNTTGEIDLSAPGSGDSDFPGTEAHYTTGNGGVDYNGMTLGGTNQSYVLFNPDIHAIGHRTNNGGNCLQTTGNSGCTIICTIPDCRIILGDDHCIYYGSGNGVIQASYIYGNNKLLIGGLCAHEGDSVIVYYASADQTVENVGGEKYTLVMSLPIAWDGLYDGKVLKGDTTTSYTNGILGVTAHVDTFTLARRMKSIIHSNVHCIVNPKSWSSTATDGYPIPGVCEPFFIRDGYGREVTNERLGGAVGQAIDWTIDDAVCFRYEQSNSSNIFIRPRLNITGTKRTGDATGAFFNLSEGVMGASSGNKVAYDYLEVVDGVIFVNADRSASGTSIIYRNCRNANITNKDRRRTYRRCIFLWNTEVSGGTNIQRFIDDGNVSVLTTAQFAEPGTGTAANWKQTCNVQSIPDTFEDCIFVFLGAASNYAYLVNSHGGMNPSIEQFRKTFNMIRPRVIGYTDGKLSDLAIINTQAEWGVIYASGSTGDGNLGEVWAPGASFGAPTGWPTNLFQTPTVALQDTDGYVTFTKTAHGLPDGARVNVEGCSDDSANGVFTAIYVDADSFKVYTGKVGTTDLVQASTRVTWLDFPVDPDWFESQDPAAEAQALADSRFRRFTRFLQM